VPKKPKKANSLEGEHIFPASQLTPLAVKWKELSSAGRHKEAMVTLEEIVIGSTAMFERLAMYEDFQYTVDLKILVSAAQERVVKWLLRWEPKKGRLFSWFSKCAKNAFRSELVKVNQFRKRYYVTSDNLEQFYGQDDHSINKHDLADEVRLRIHDLTCRWGDPQEIGAIRFLIECIIDDEHEKPKAIWSAAYAYGISLEQSKFFYGWSLAALRHTMFDKIHVPFTRQDLFRAAESYSYLVDLLDIITWDQMEKIIAIHGGKRFKIPTLAYMTKLSDDFKLFRDLDKSDLDPDSVAAVARAHKKTPRTAQEVYNDMVTTIDPKRYGEHSVYEPTERDY
jgi:hypothetical protein